MEKISFESFFLEKTKKISFENFLIFTYSFDEYGLEFVQKEINFKGKGIIFVGDMHGFNSTIKNKKENIYIVPVNDKNKDYKCHCKLYLFETTENKYLLILGSANLNQNSLTENREFVACFDSEQNPTIFTQAGEFLKKLEKSLSLNYPEKKLYRKFYTGLKKCRSNKNKKSDCTFIHSLDRPMIEHLNSSKIMKVVSPSFDHSKNIFEEYEKRLKIKEIYTSGDTLETNDEVLKKINKDIKSKRIINHLHGKFYELDDGRKMFGSPNFTTAGLCGCWKDGTGNLETAIIYKNGPSLTDLIIIKDYQVVDKFESTSPSADDKDSGEKLLLLGAYHNEIILKDDKKEKISIEIEFGEKYRDDFILKLKCNNKEWWLKKANNSKNKSNSNYTYLSFETDISYNDYKELLESVDAQVILKYDNKEEKCGLTIFRIVNQCFSGEEVDKNVDPLDALINESISVKYNDSEEPEVDNTKNGGGGNGPTQPNELNITQYHDYPARILQSKMKIIKRRILNGEKQLINTICQGIEKWNYYKKAEKLFILSVLKDIVDEKKWIDLKRNLYNIYKELKTEVELSVAKIEPDKENNKKESERSKKKLLKKLKLTDEQKDLVNRVMRGFYGKKKAGVLIADRVGSGKSFEALEIIRRIVSKEGLKRCAIFAPRYLISEWLKVVKVECNDAQFNSKRFCKYYEECKEERNDAKCIIKHLKNYIEKNDIKRLSRNELLRKLKINKNSIDKLGHIYKYVFIKWNDLRKDKKVLNFFLKAQECWTKSKIRRNRINLISISQMKNFKKARLDIAVVDEIQYLKGGTKERDGAFGNIIKNSPGNMFRIFLSGTPFETNVNYEAFRILRLLLPKNELNKTKDHPNKIENKEKLSKARKTLYDIFKCLTKLHNLIYEAKKTREPEELARILMNIYILADLKHSFDIKQDDAQKIREELKELKHEEGLDELLRYFMARQRPEKLLSKPSAGFANKDNWVECSADNDSLFNTLNLRAELYCREELKKKKKKKKKKDGVAPVEDLIRFTSALYQFWKEKKKKDGVAPVEDLIRFTSALYQFWKEKEKKCKTIINGLVEKKHRFDKLDYRYHPKFYACIKEIKNQCKDKSQGILGERVVVFVHHVAMARYLRNWLNNLFDKEKYSNENSGQNTKNDLGKFWWKQLTKKSDSNVKRKRKYIIQMLRKYANFMELSEEDLQNENNKDAPNLDPKSVYHFRFAECFNYPRRYKKHVEHIKDIKSYFNDPEKLFPRVLIFVRKGTNGINIQRDCRKLIHFNLHFNPGVLEQREGRVNRPNHKPGKVIIKSIILKNSYDCEILARAVFRMRLIDLLGGFAPFWCEENIRVLVDQIFSEEQTGNMKEHLRKVGKEIDRLQRKWKVIDKENIGKDKWNKEVTFKYLKKYVLCP